MSFFITNNNNGSVLYSFYSLMRWAVSWATRGNRGQAQETKFMVNSQVLEPGGGACQGKMQRWSGGRRQEGVRA